MSRFLFVVPPFAGHINPTISLASALVERGHEVAWTGPPGMVQQQLPPDATFLPLVSELIDQLNLGSRGTARGAAGFKGLWEGYLVPLARICEPMLMEVAADYRPDVMVVDQQTVAGAVVARRLGIPWATSATTSAELTNPLIDLPKVASWVRDMLFDFQIERGCEENGEEREAWKRGCNNRN